MIIAFAHKITREDLDRIKSKAFVTEPNEIPGSVNTWLSDALTSLKAPGMVDDKTFFPKIPASTLLEIGGEEIELKIKNYYLVMRDLLFLDIIQNNPDKRIYTTNSGQFRSLGLRNHCKIRIPVVSELTSSGDLERIDSASIPLIKKSVNDLNLSYIKGAKAIGENQLLNHFYAILVFPESNINDLNALAENNGRKIPYTNAH